MTNDLLTALAGFALVSSITPGPNNLMLMASGANYGFRRSIPHMLGIASGFVVMVCLVGVGLIGLFDAWPPAHTILTVVSVAYLLWLAWKIAHASAPRRGEGTGRPFTFLQAALFQWVNPKAWLMLITVVASYANPQQFVLSVAMIAVIFFLMGIPLISAWNIGGVALKGWLQQGQRLLRFNQAMAVLLLASMAPMWM